MDCGSCAAKIEHVVSALDDVETVRVDLALARMKVELRDDGDATRLAGAVRALGFTVAELGEGATRHAPAPQKPIWQDPRLAAVGIGVVAMVLGAITQSVPLYVVAIALGGFYVFRNALSSARHLHLDINVLMTIAVLGAMVIGEWFEAATVVVLFAFAEWLEGASMTRARRAIRDLMELAPPMARVLRGGAEVELGADDVVIDDVVVVRPGERVPLDGLVRAGESDVDQSPLTGESVPVHKAVGDEVFAGTVNTVGTLEVRVTKPASDSTIAHVLRAIEQAQENRSESERFIERFARWYTPAVVAIAVGIAVLPPLLGGGDWHEWFYRALVMLVIACPCALVIATPITTVSALAGAARDGLLIKGGRYLEELGAIRALVFDKTGTLTEGLLSVHEVVGSAAWTADDVLEVAAFAEQQSEHYIARAIVRETVHREISPPAHRMRRVEAHPGAGVEAHIDLCVKAPMIAGIGRIKIAHQHDHNCDHDHDLDEHASHAHEEARILVGTRTLLERFQIDFTGLDDEWHRLESHGSTVVGVTRDDELIGIIECRDTVRATARDTLEALRSMGIAEIHLCTGDNAIAAASLADSVGLDPNHVHAGLFPEDKVAILETLRAKFGHVAMVGDGINDAPALAAASVGIAMGAAGTDVALETAHVALMEDRLERVPSAIRLGRSTVRIIRQNVILALGIKAVVFGLATAGVATLWMAIAADMGTSLLVIANGLRSGRRA